MPEDFFLRDEPMGTARPARPSLSMGCPAAPFVPTSAKRPHWVLLGPRAALRGVHRHSVLGTPMVSFEGAPGDELFVADEACPHRGASLARGEVRGSCLVCPYHGGELGVMTHPARFFDYASHSGLVWVDLARRVFAQHHPPPRPPAPASWTADYVTVVPAHPMAVVESLLTVTSLGGARVEGGPLGRASWTDGGVHVRVWYEVPYTACVESTVDGRSTSAWLSVTPLDDGVTRVHARVSRTDEEDGPDLGLWRNLSSAGPLRGLLYSWDGALRVDEDVLVAEYRKAVRETVPDLAAYWGLT